MQSLRNIKEMMKLKLYKDNYKTIFCLKLSLRRTRCGLRALELKDFCDHHSPESSHWTEQKPEMGNDLTKVTHVRYQLCPRDAGRFCFFCFKDIPPTLWPQYIHSFAS